MNTLRFLAVLLLSVSFLSSCEQENTTSEYDKGYEKGESVYDYTDLIYNEETASFSLPTTLTVEQSFKIYGLYALYNTYNENSGTSEWRSGFISGAASGVLGDEGALALTNFFEDEDTALAFGVLLSSLSN